MYMYVPRNLSMFPRARYVCTHEAVCLHSDDGDVGVRSKARRKVEPFCIGPPVIVSFSVVCSRLGLQFDLLRKRLVVRNHDIGTTLEVVHWKYLQSPPVSP